MIDEGKVKALVEALVKERFPQAVILKVEISEDVDFEDDPILRVRVVFEANENALDTDRTTGFVRHLRSALSKIDVSAFPVMSFISSQDAGLAA